MVITAAWLQGHDAPVQPSGNSCDILSGVIITGRATQSRPLRLTCASKSGLDPLLNAPSTLILSYSFPVSRLSPFQGDKNSELKEGQEQGQVHLNNIGCC